VFYTLQHMRYLMEELELRVFSVRVASALTSTGLDLSLKSQPATPINPPITSVQSVAHLTGPGQEKRMTALDY